MTSRFLPLSATLFSALFITAFLNGVPASQPEAGKAFASPVGERPDALRLRFSIKDEHIVSWKRKEKGVWIRMSPGATSSFYRFTSAHVNEAFDLYINGLYVISIMNTSPVKSGGLFINVRKDAQEAVVRYLPMRLEKFD